MSAEIVDRLRAIATEASGLADQVERALADGSEATRTLDALRVTLGIAAPAPERKVAPPRVVAADTSNPRPVVARSSVEDPTNCEAPGCGRPLVQSGTGRKRHFCDGRCRDRSRRVSAAAAPAALSRVDRRGSIAAAVARRGAADVAEFEEEGDAAPAPPQVTAVAPRISSSWTVADGATRRTA